MASLDIGSSQLGEVSRSEEVSGSSATMKRLAHRRVRGWRRHHRREP